MFHKLKLTFRATILLLVGCLAVAASATPLLNTLAWTRYYAVQYGAAAVDAEGDFCVVTAQPNGGTGMMDYYLARYDISGNAVTYKLLFSLDQAGAYTPDVVVSPPIEGKEFIYVMAEGSNAMNGSYTYVFKCDLNGVYKWSDTRTSQNGAYAVKGAADAAGNFYATLTVPSMGLIDGFEMVEYGGNGTLLHDFTVSDMTFPDAQFVGGKWSVVGVKDSFSFLPKWAVFDPTTGVETAKVEFPSVDNGAYRYDYTITGYTHPNGTVYLGITVRKFEDGGSSSPVLINHFIRSYSLAGALHWTSSPYGGYIYWLTGSGAASCPLWVVGAATPKFDQTNSYFVERFESAGSRTFQKPLLSAFETFPSVEDANQTFFLSTDPNYHRKLTVTQLDSSGNLGTSLSLSTAVGASTDRSRFVNAFLRNGSLYACGGLPSLSQIAVQRYVSGVTLASLSSTGSVVGGGTIPLKVMLNSPSPTGGMLVKLTSNNAKLLFPNNGTVYTAAIPAGSIYANITLHSSSVSTNTPVLLTGNQNGVVRQAVITVTH